MITPGWFDVATAAYVVYGIRKGRKRRLSGEFPGVVCVLVFAITGGGLFHWTERALAEASQTVKKYVGGVSFVSLAIASFVMVQLFKRKMRAWADSRFEATWQKVGGPVLGGVRCFVVAVIVLMVCGHGPLRVLVDGSWMGKVQNAWVGKEASS